MHSFELNIVNYLHSLEQRIAVHSVQHIVSVVFLCLQEFHSRVLLRTLYCLPMHEELQYIVVSRKMSGWNDLHSFTVCFC